MNKLETWRYSTWSRRARFSRSVVHFPQVFVSARKSAAYYQADTTSWHPGFAEPFPHRYLIKQLSTYVVPGMPPTFGSLIAPGMGGTQVHRIGGPYGNHCHAGERNN